MPPITPNPYPALLAPSVKPPVGAAEIPANDTHIDQLDTYQSLAVAGQELVNPLSNVT